MAAVAAHRTNTIKIIEKYVHAYKHINGSKKKIIANFSYRTCSWYTRSSAQENVSNGT